MTPESARAEIAATMRRLALAETDLGALAATITRRGPVSTVPSTLPRVSLVPDASTDLAIVRELARGGMGIVHLAEQRSLEREVAVKTARTRDAAIGAALVREARIMGALEHPSLVPVHALGIDPDGGPVLVMKRIEGVSWRTLLAEPDHEAWAPLLAGHGDRLRANVEILAQICRALAFAHDRGVVHRDLKPDNVMIGRFGEVYLLDWGVALRMADAASEPEGIVGTPAYLAPEMARGKPSEVDARTDVYLLGATLYEIVTGRFPHEAPTPVAALVSALLGEVPPVGDDVAPELAELVATSMAADRDARTPSAEAFRLGLMRFISARDADVLVRDASTARTEADALLEKEGATSALGFRRLIEARFALVSALRLRPSDRRARAALDDCLARLARRDLELGSPAGARAYASEMETTRPDLLDAIGASESRLDVERRARAERDTSPLSRVLTIGMGVITVGWVIWVATIRGVAEGPVEPVSSIVAITILSLPLLAVVAVTWRRLVATDATRRLFAFFVIWYLSGPAFLLPSALRGEESFDPVPAMLGDAFLLAVASLSLMPELWPSVVLSLVAAGLMLYRPGHTFAIMSPFLVLNGIVVVRGLRLRGQRTRVTP